MNKHTLVLCLLLPGSWAQAKQQEKKFILHFDINKTIIAEDMGNGDKTIDKIIIESLAKRYTGLWDTTLTQEMSFKEYVEKIACPGPKDDREIRKKRQLMVHAFFDFLAAHNDPRLPEIKKRFETLHQKITSQVGKVFHSFYYLLHYLDSKEIPYAIILRTFGADGQSVAQEITTHSGLAFSWQGRFHETVLTLHALQTNESIVLDNPHDLFTFFQHNGHMHIRDDFPYWNTHEELASFGKLFPIHAHNIEIISIFFDDNAYNNIINVHPLDQTPSLSCDALIKQGFILPVDTIDAIENDAYFVEHLMRFGFIS